MDACFNILHLKNQVVFLLPDQEKNAFVTIHRHNRHNKHSFQLFSGGHNS